MTDRPQPILPAICITSITFSSLARAAAPEITEEDPVYVPPWIFGLKTDSRELIKNTGYMKSVSVNTKELIKLLRCLNAWELC